MPSDANTLLDNVLREAEHLYGDTAPPVDGILHVVSAWRAEPERRLHVLAIHDGSPKSTSDFFILNFWRAHSDAILTTAQVARAEPKLSHELQGPLAEGLELYRAQILGKSRAPWCAVLTRSGALPADHGMFADQLDYVVLTPTETASRMRASLGPTAEVVGRDALDVRDALAFMRERGARTILIEAGPSTANQLYTETPSVDHLMLSLCEAQHIDPAAVGGALPPDAQLFAGLVRKSEVVRQEQSGPWRFLRFARGDHKR